MREHYKQIIGNKEDKDIMEWANKCPGNENIQITGFKHGNLKNGVFLINCLASLDPEVIDWDLINKDPNADEEAIKLNAKYAISIARKHGAIIFMVCDDVMELNSKMLLIFLCSVYELAMEKAA